MRRKSLTMPSMPKMPPISAGPFGSPTPMVGSGPPEPGGNHDMPAGVMPLPYDHPLGGLQREIHRKLPIGHPLKGLQNMLRPKLPVGHPLKQMQTKLLG